MTTIGFKTGLLSVCVASLLAPVSAARAQDAVGAVVPGRYLVAFRGGQMPADVEMQVGLAGGRVLGRAAEMGIAVVQAPGSGARSRLAAAAGVEAVAEDRVVMGHGLEVKVQPQPVRAITLAPDELYKSPQGWAVKAVGGMPAVWAVTQGAGVRIAVLDSGVDAAHPDLARNLVFNLSEVDQVALPSPCDDGTPQDQQGHGTWTASLAAGAMGVGTGQMVGVAPEASILNIKVLERMPAVAGDANSCAQGEAYGLLSWVIQGINDAVAQKADVVQMSLGTLVDVTTGEGAGLKVMFDQVTHRAAQAGVVLVAAAGNDGFDLADQGYVELPAEARDVLAVTATTNPACQENLLAGAGCVAGAASVPYYSNYGSPLNAVSAPGGSYPSTTDLTEANGWIYGACSQSGCFGFGTMAYVQAMGTSASAALVAGAAALLRGAHPNWDQATVVAALRGSGGGVNVAGVLVP